MPKQGTKAAWKQHGLKHLVTCWSFNSKLSPQVGNSAYPGHSRQHASQLHPRAHWSYTLVCRKLLEWGAMFGSRRIADKHEPPLFQPIKCSRLPVITVFWAAAHTAPNYGVEENCSNLIARSTKYGNVEPFYCMQSVCSENRRNVWHYIGVQEPENFPHLIWTHPTHFEPTQKWPKLKTTNSGRPHLKPWTTPKTHIWTLNEIHH